LDRRETQSRDWAAHGKEPLARASTRAVDPGAVPKPASMHRTSHLFRRSALICASRAVTSLLPVVLLVACAAQSRTVGQEVRSLVDHGRFEEGVQMAADAAAKDPGNPEMQELYRDATVAYLLEQGRRLTFEDKDEEALAFMQRALETNPDSEEAADWIEKTNKKLALKHLDIALEEHAKDEIQKALANYEKALQFMPADKDALIGRDICVRILQRREGLGKSYFDEGVRALSEYWLEQARSRFSYSHKYQPADARTTDRRVLVEKLLAAQRMSAGRAFEKAGRFGSARNEYRVAHALDQGNEEARAGLERVQRELDVRAVLDRAKMHIVRGDFDEASKLAEEAGEKTVAQKDKVEGMVASIREGRLERQYRDALVLEHDFRYEDAVGKYDELLEKAQFYKDVIARRDTLQEYMRLAAELYEKAAAEGSGEKKLEYLQQIRVFWPEYKDIQAQIAELEKTTQSP
jgi:tetratricopeptide (TPR) repeat protein